MTGGEQQYFYPSAELYEGMSMPEELRFMADFAVNSGDQAAAMRAEAIQSFKIDRTVVTDWDKRIERSFREAVAVRSGGKDEVIGEEEKSKPFSRDGVIWVIDPIDGTLEFTQDYKDNGEPWQDSERTTCVGIAQFKDGRLVRSVAYNPFTRELVVADDELGGAFLNGQPLRLYQGEAGNVPFVRGIPYDYAYWDGAPVDPRGFNQVLGQPRDRFSTIQQAVDVARGMSAFSVFAGQTIHDIAPAAKIVEMAGGIVSAPDGRPLDWQNLCGAVYSNGVVHPSVVAALQLNA